MFVLFVLISLSPLAVCDVYLHNLRGSNNRADENGRGRTNAQRLFDSQNNGRGGYNLGETMKFFEGSSLQIEWTQQHSCADQNNECNIVLQYMCDPCIRDGNTTNTIPLELNSACINEVPGNAQYGMHEKLESYLSCGTRPRNGGLFVANSNLKKSAISTRQNPQGTRYGFECAEERDYYPYWRPTGWRDIAVLMDTKDFSNRCKYYQSKSENVSPRGYCYFPMALMLASLSKGDLLPDDEVSCNNNSVLYGSKWIEVPSPSLPPPQCLAPEYSRDNHLGNAGKGASARGFPSVFNWTLPLVTSAQKCVLRVRYNISTGDYSSWVTTDAQRASRVNEEIAVAGGMSKDGANTRGYTLTNNPKVSLFSDLPNLTLQLAVNPAQFGRTFQDRSHVFYILPRSSNPSLSSTKKIHNINVRGKRGNIVQTYPGVEYDFVPDTVFVKSGEYAHFQWTGSNNNNGNNAGQGTAGTDRSNVVVMADSSYNKRGVSNTSQPPLAYRLFAKSVYGQWSRAYPTDNSSLISLASLEQMQKLAFLGGTTGGQLNEMSPYFDMGPMEMKGSSVYHYMSTRNNDFSNRSQKGRLIVTDLSVETLLIGPSGGTVSTSDGLLSVYVPEGVLSDSNLFVNILTMSDSMETDALNYFGIRAPPGDSYVSSFFFVTLSDTLSSNKLIKFTVRLSSSSCSSSIAVYGAFTLGNGMPDSSGVWQMLNGMPTCQDGYVSFYLGEENDNSMVFVVRQHSVTLRILLGVLSVFVVIAMIIVATCIYCRRHPSVMRQYQVMFQSNFSQTKHPGI